MREAGDKSCLVGATGNRQVGRGGVTLCDVENARRALPPLVKGWMSADYA